MFSLLVGLNDGVVPDGRLFEHTDSTVRVGLGTDYISTLQSLPALSMPEVRDERYEQVATVGTITRLRKSSKEHLFTFVPHPHIRPISSSAIQKIAAQLGVASGGWEFSRTHWAVKDIDLYEAILEHHAQQRTLGSPKASGAINFPTQLAQDPQLVAVMMPFSPSFDVVYETIESAANDAGLKCSRADDIWDHDHVMDDVLSLLWRAEVVVADLTGRNANVFYETGLAHALPRRTVLLTQTPTDVPFDLRSIRYLHYGLGTSERAKLRKQLSERLTKLIEQSRV